MHIIAVAIFLMRDVSSVKNLQSMHSSGEMLIVEFTSDPTVTENRGSYG